MLVFEEQEMCICRGMQVKLREIGSLQGSVLDHEGEVDMATKSWPALFEIVIELYTSFR